MKFNIKDLLFWFFLILFVVLVLWRIFGNSPSDVAIVSAVLGIVLVRMFDFSREFGRIDGRLVKLECGVKNGFENIKRDMKFIKNKVVVLK